MLQEKRMEILTLKELNSEEWRERARNSVECAYDEATGKATPTSEAQEVLLNFVLNMGGIRKDVYEYLLYPRFQDSASVASMGILLCYAASVEWVQLAVQALQKNRISGTLYVNEITEAYKAGIQVDVMRQLLKESETVFELCQRRIGLTLREEGRIGALREETQSQIKVQSQEKAVKQDRQSAPAAGMEADMAKVVTDAVLTAMQKFMGGMASSREQIKENDRENHESMQESLTEQPEKALKEYLPEQPKDVEFKERQGEQKEQEANVQEKQGNEHHEAPEFPDGKELLDNRMLVTELREAEKAHGERVSFFQILLSRHMKKAFEKLDPEDQVGKIFEIMVEKKYKKDKILAIRRLMNGGMTNEFIFSLLEKDLPEEELMELCDTLVEDMPGMERDVIDTDTEGEREQEDEKEENQ